MPAKSAKQERFMQAVAHNPKFAKKVGVPVTVGQEFTKSGGGEMKKMAKGGTVGASKMGAVKTAAPSRDGVAVKGKTRAVAKDSGKTVGIQSGARGMKRGGKA